MASEGDFVSDFLSHLDESWMLVLFAKSLDQVKDFVGQMSR